MAIAVRKVDTFPFVRLPSYSDGLPVEVALIAQLGPGSGDPLIADALARQRAHEAFVDALDEPSVRLGGVDLAKGDTTSLYSFAVGANGHPFHRHAGHRVFTAISGSAGARLRFSTASPAQIAEDPRHFVHALRHVDIPPDSLFTVRFGGGTWHQFVPLRARSTHPALFALSCHTNELGGDLPEASRQRVIDNAADIPSLTELLPREVSTLLEEGALERARVPTFVLSMTAPAASWAGRACVRIRSVVGRLRGALGRLRGPVGFLADEGGSRAVVQLDAPSAGSLLLDELQPGFDHEDSFQLTVAPGELSARKASVVLAALLEGFLENRPRGVSRLMALRNVLVKPLRLRTSPLGCPVSSLLAPDAQMRFAGRFPVLRQQVADGDIRAQVVLGADDRHLSFRSCVDVSLAGDGRIVFTLGTRVRTRNAFGRVYMSAIDPVHRGYITPAMLRLAVEHAVGLLHEHAPAAADMPEPMLPACVG